MENKERVYEIYEKIADWYAGSRSRELIEKPYLDQAMSCLQPGAKILDLGCGMGDPIAKYFIGQGFNLTGIDGSQKLIDFARKQFPDSKSADR